jgi:hypothetical protein
VTSGNPEDNDPGEHEQVERNGREPGKRKELAIPPW